MDSVIRAANFVIITTSSSSKEFEIKNLEDVVKNSGTYGIYMDECVRNVIKKDEELIKYFNFPTSNGVARKLNNFNNPYFMVCGADDYFVVQDMKYNNGTIITNDYGMFACAIIEGSKPYYLVNKEQLKRGKRYFFEKVFKKKINSLIWRQLNKKNI